MKWKVYLTVLSGVLGCLAISDAKLFFMRTIQTGGGNVLAFAAFIAIPFWIYAMMDPNNPNALVKSRDLRPDEKKLNPATGLPMCGAFDARGNAYGCDDDQD
jgi:hypothetical protein